MLPLYHISSRTIYFVLLRWRTLARLLGEAYVLGLTLLAAQTAPLK